MTFAELLVTQRKVSDLDKMYELIRWERFRYRIKKMLDRSAEGRPPYDEMCMFRVMILQNLYNLSDRQMEEMLYDRLSFRRFCGFGLDSPLPDSTTILRFRNLLQGQSEKLLEMVNEELQGKGISWSSGSIVDATVIESAYKAPPGGEQSVVDSEAGWTKKRGKYTYGYKAHISTTKKGLIRKTKATSADIYDGWVLPSVLEGRETKVYADKAYGSKKNRKLLKDHGIKDGLLHKKPKGKSLEDSLKTLNKINAQIRATIERTFAHLKTLFHYRRARYKGWDKNQVHLDLLAISYNLKRSLRLAIG
jgi:IS5 family transposase